ncbi:MAG: Ig-like domain-containing protein [Firmicutes bacterium]|nr:Ig-like domain-containing protein [Bacillota bacterium]
MKYSFASRVLAIMLSIGMVLGMLPVGSVRAEEGAVYGTVSMLTDGAVISGNATAEVTVQFAGGSTVEWYAADTSIGRYQDGWWAGIQITAPAGIDVENAKYCFNEDYDDVRAFWTYKDSTDDADEQFIYVWIPLNDIIDGSFAARTIHFDWDNDDVYEQTITIDVDAGAIVLMKDGTQIYPALASVVSYSGGTISGDATGNVAVTLEDIALDWEAADESAGKDIDAWWVGIKVTAPSEMMEEQLADSVYQERASADSAWSDSLSFWSNKNSQTGDSEHYIGLWLPLTPAILEAAIESGRDITMYYQFDWDGDGTFEQSIAVCVNPDGVTLNKKDQTGFAFETPSPASIMVSVGSYKNEAIGGQGDGSVSYEIVEGGEYAAIAADGTLSFSDIGDNESVAITVKATKAVDSNGFYNEATAEYTVTLCKESQNPRFTFPNPDKITYEPDLQFANPLWEETYEGSVSYKVDDDSVATVDNDGTLKILKAGTVTVTASVSGNGVYNSAEVSYTLTIEKAEQTEFAFKNPNPDEVCFNENENIYENIAQNGMGSGELVYSIVSGSDVATVDDSGKLTIYKAGEVTVQAQKKGDECYEDSTIITYTLVIHKADQTLTFTESSIEAYYGILSYTNTSLTPSDPCGSGEVTYEIVDKNNTIGAAIKETGEVTFTESEGKVGSITVRATRAADDCYNACSAEYTITLTYLQIEDSCTLSGAKNDNGWYKGEVTISAPDGCKISDSNALFNENWEDCLTIDTEGANQEVTVYLKNEEGITDAVVIAGINIDKTNPENIQISYSTYVVEKVMEGLTFGFYQADVVVTVTAEDVTAGVDYFTLTYTRQDGASSTNAETFTVEHLQAEQDADNGSLFTACYTIPAPARGTVSVIAVDKAGNESTSMDDTILVVDATSPEREVSYSSPDKVLNAETLLEEESIPEGEDVILYYKSEATIGFRITEANFDLALLSEEGKPTVRVNGTPVELEWTRYEQEGEEDVWVAEHTITGDGDYVVTMTYMDWSGNEMQEYESYKIVIDGTAPTVEIRYSGGEATQILDGVPNYGGPQTVTIQITDHSFRAEDVQLSVEARDITGAAVEVTDYAEYAKDPDNWTTEGDIHTLNTEGMVFGTDAIYSLKLECTDLMGNSLEPYAAEFVIDKTGTENIQISYSTAVVEKIMEGLTFGFYQADVVVTVTAEDVTAGVDYFTLTYTRQDGASSTNAETFTVEHLQAEQDADNGSLFTACYTIPAPARGTVSVIAVDKAGNESTSMDDTILVVDNIAPEISVTYKAQDDSTKVQFIDNEFQTVDTFDSASGAVYNGNVTASIVINEANFFEGVSASEGVIHQVGIRLTKTDDNGNTTVTEYLPADSEPMYPDAETAYITWTTEGDEHSFSILYAENADYVLEIVYTDLPANEANITADDGQKTTESYTSKTITVDKIAPAIQVVYSNTEAQNTIAGRDYFNQAQSATITVTEHNFRASDVQAVVTAVDFLGENVIVADFAAQLANEENWTHDGNVHTAVVEYTLDANYAFDISFRDLAQNESEDYAIDLFTVDTTAPTNLTVSYSTNVFQEILQSITFGYYNATMTVTISADDPTTGIYRFAYSYINGEGVSGLNKELLDAAIAAAEIRHNGITAIASLSIPKMVLGNDNQFNGTFSFTAYDCSENSTELKDTTRIIVDNISPTATITYSEPVQNIQDVAYYDGNIEVMITITEANFDSADVVVMLSKDGESYPAAVTWVDNSVDRHTGSFVLAEDGEYYVSVQYKDKSGNTMEDYMSNALTLDTSAPSIRVSNIQANSANKDSEYGFTITFSDTNLDTSSIRPTLKAIKETAEGIYEIVEIDLGEAEALTDGQVYAFTVDNLPDDGLYTLICEACDLAGNAMSKVILDDGQAYKQVSFSINRGGSTFGYGSEFTEKLVGQYYVYSVDDDLVIVELNVDPIDCYIVSLNGRELVEGTEYTSEQISDDGEWCKRVYTIHKELFAAEGEYSILITSTDKTNTTAFSDVKNLSLSFVVDQTEPVLTITGLASGGRYQTDVQTVTLIPTDEGGRLNSLTVIVLDADGNPLQDSETGEDISIRFEMSGEELLQYLEDNDGKIVFTIPSGYNNKVQIICNDCAINAQNLTNEYNVIFENVTVSQNWLVIFYANKSVFFGTIASILMLLLILILLIKRMKDKKSKKKA